MQIQRQNEPRSVAKPEYPPDCKLPLVSSEARFERNFEARRVADLPTLSEFSKFKRYTPLTKIHKGRTSVLYLARHELSGENRILKIVDPSLDRGAACASYDSVPWHELEVQALQVLKERHFRGLVRVYEQEYLPESCRLCYAMEAADSGASGRHTARMYHPTSLQDRLSEFDKDNPIPEALALRWLHQIACGIAELHHAELMHRDIKPSNIIFVNSVPKVADIGLVAPHRMLHRFVGGGVVGTVGYVAPELASTQVADIFSLGKTFYEILSSLGYQETPGRSFEGHSAHPSNRNAKLERILQKMCAKEPTMRHTNAVELLSELETL